MPDGTVTIKINVDGKDAEIELGKVTGQIEDAGATAEDVSESTQRNTAALTVALAAIAASLVAAGLKAYQFSSQFNAAFAKTQTIMDTNVMKAEEMRQAVLDLSRDSAMAAGDVSEAVYQAISGSVDTADAVKFVEKANKLAVAGFTSLTNATDVLTTSLNAYHLSADQVDGISNVLIRTQNLGKTSVDELSSSMGKAIATGSAYGVNLQNLSTAYVELTRSGINTAESTTYINSMLNELGDSGKTVGKILQEKTGKSFGQLMQDGASLGDVLEILLESVDGNTEAFMGLWGSQEAGKAANAIASQSIQDFNKVLEQMNAEMGGATGTTEQAYETMTSTSEFIDKRLTNSVHNLAIAYGDVLAPPMDAIKSLGADILEGLTDLIRSSPALASAIAAISTGVIVFVGGLTAYVAITKIATIVQTAMNTAMMSNPFLLAAAAVAALVVGIVSYVGSMSEANEKLDEFNEKQNTIENSYFSELAKIEETDKQVEGYINRLEELEATGLKTTEQHKEYHEILEKLIDAVPELSDIIDLENDVINGGIPALKERTKALQENAKELAKQSYLADLTEAYTEALVRQETVSLKLSSHEKRKEDIDAEVEAMQTLHDKISDEERSYEGLSDATEREALAIEAVKEKMKESNGVYDAVYQVLNELKGEQEDESETLISLQSEYKNYGEVVEKASEELEYAKRVVEGLTEAEGPAIDGAEKLGDEIGGAGDQALATSEKIAMIKTKTPEITESIQAWADKYGELYKAAKSSLEKQFKLWEEVEQVTSVSVKEANKGIQSQIDYWNDYNDNLQTIKDSGIEGIEQLYQFISDGSTDSVAMAAGIADAIREGNEPAVQNMIGLYEDLAAAQGETADSMLSMQTDMDKALDELVASVDTAVGNMELPDDAWTAAHETVLAYARGLYSGKSDAVSAARSVANAASSALYSNSKSSGRSGGPQMQAYASGTSYADAGLALVGEEGPELIWLRGGERILTSDETREALRGMYPVLDSASYAGAAAPASVGGSPAGAQEMTIVVPVEIDGRELARVTAQTMGEEMMFSAY